MRFFMERNKTYNRKKICIFCFLIFICGFLLIGRLIYLMIFRHDYYTEKAIELQQRERKIKAARGEIVDRNGVVLATNEAVCTISVIHNQITDAENVIQVLCEELELSGEYVRKRVEKVTSIEKIKTNVLPTNQEDICSLFKKSGCKFRQIDSPVFPNMPVFILEIFIRITLFIQ